MSMSDALLEMLWLCRRGRGLLRLFGRIAHCLLFCFACDISPVSKEVILN